MNFFRSCWLKHVSAFAPTSAKKIEHDLWFRIFLAHHRQRGSSKKCWDWIFDQLTTLSEVVYQLYQKDWSATTKEATTIISQDNNVKTDKSEVRPRDCLFRPFATSSTVWCHRDNNYVYVWLQAVLTRMFRVQSFEFSFSCRNYFIPTHSLYFFWFEKCFRHWLFCWTSKREIGQCYLPWSLVCVWTKPKQVGTSLGCLSTQLVLSSSHGSGHHNGCISVFLLCHQSEPSIFFASWRHIHFQMSPVVHKFSQSLCPSSTSLNSMTTVKPSRLSKGFDSEVTTAVFLLEPIAFIAECGVLFHNIFFNPEPR